VAEEFDALIKLMRATSEEAVPFAENAAAKVYKDAAIAAAPRRTGQLAASIKIIEGRRLRTLTGETRRRLFVGPEKRKGYYGYWLEKGRKGFDVAVRKLSKTKAKALHWKDKSGKDVFMNRAHVPPMGKREWFYPSQRSVDGAAEDAASAAFEAKLAEIDSRTQ